MRGDAGVFMCVKIVPYLDAAHGGPRGDAHVLTCVDDSSIVVHIYTHMINQSIKSIKSINQPPTTRTRRRPRAVRPVAVPVGAVRKEGVAVYRRRFRSRAPLQLLWSKCVE